MKSISKAIRSLEAKLEQQVDKREETFSSRSILWQIGPKGEEYQRVTFEVENIKDQLIDLKEEYHELFKN